MLDQKKKMKRKIKKKKQVVYEIGLFMAVLKINEKQIISVPYQIRIVSQSRKKNNRNQLNSYALLVNLKLVLKET